MVTYCATKLTATCSPMIGHFVDTMILASTYKRVVIMTYQTVSLGKYWNLFSTTLTNCQIVRPRSLPHRINYKIRVSVCLLTIKISQ